MAGHKNWFLKGKLDGYKTAIGKETKGQQGGFSLTIYQRDEGKSVVAAQISGFAHDNGRLNLTIRVNDAKGSLPIAGTFDTDR